MKGINMLTILVLALGLMAWQVEVSEAVPMGTAFTYQGRLIDANDAADGLYDLQFKLFDDPNIVIGKQIGSTIDVNDMDVIDGYFTVELDFGGDVFNGDSRWLEIVVRAGDSNDPNAFASLSPRQEVTPAPYALYAKTAGGDNDWMVTGNNMYAIPSGNVGIGTASPTDELTIGDGGKLGINSAGNDKHLRLYHDDTDSKITGSSGHIYVVPPVSKSLYVRPVQPGYDYGNPQTAIDALVQHGGDGFGTIKAINVKAWTNSWTNFDKQLYGIYAETSDTRTGRDAATTTSYGIYGKAAGTTWGSSTAYGIYGTASGADRNWAGYFDDGNVYIKNKLGVGTTTPAAKLHIAGTPGVDGIKFPDGTTQTTAASPSWNLTGNNGTSPGTNFLGTTDNVALELHVNGQRALRIEPDAVSPNLIIGYSGNIVTSGVVGAIIGGGGLSGGTNHVTDDYCTVGGGRNNRAGNDSGTTSDAPQATVGGGGYNTAGNASATVGGGFDNSASGNQSTIAGGGQNTASNMYATVGGGLSNTASGSYATVGGGLGNIASGGFHATVPGGQQNTAQGSWSFAAGRRAKANHQGAFVWADSTNADFASTGVNQFVIRASGGVGIGTTSPAYDLDVDGNIRAIGSVFYGGTEGNADGTLYLKPDYVFEEGYDVMSIEQVETYLKNENHLPWMTSAKQEKEENGNVIDMTRMAFETVETAENLQIQVIELNKLIKEQAALIKTQQKRISALEETFAQNEMLKQKLEVLEKTIQKNRLSLVR